MNIYITLFPEETAAPLLIKELSDSLALEEALEATPSAGSAGTANLTAWWSLDDDANASAVDAHGSYDLTDAAGDIGKDTSAYKQGSARVSAGRDTSRRLYHATPGTALGGNGEFTCALWVRLDDVFHDYACIVGRWKEWGAGSWGLMWDNYNAPTGIQFWVRESQWGDPIRITAAESSATKGVWHFVAFGYDGTHSWIRMDDGDRVEVETDAPYYASGNDFSLFNTSPGDAAAWSSMQGQIDECCLYDGRTLNDTELDHLYNDGAGRAYSELTTSVDLTLDVSDALDLAEALDVGLEGDYGGLEYFVSPTSNPAGDGSLANPFDSIEAAVAAIRTATGRTTTGGAPAEGWLGARITLLAGDHVRLSKVALDWRDSGNASHPLEIRADPGATVRLLGSVAAPQSGWLEVVSSGAGAGQVDDSWAYDRIPVAARGQVYRFDVSTVTNDYGGMEHELFDMLRLVVGGNLARMSRWPNGDTKDASAWTDISAAEGNTQFDVASATPLGWDYSNQKLYMCGVWAWDGSAMFNYYHNWATLGGVISNGGGGSRFAASTYGGFPFGTGSGTAIAIRNGVEFLEAGTYAWRNVGSAHYIYLWSASGAPSDARLTVLDDLLELNARTGESFGVFDDTRGVNHVTFRDLIIGDVRRQAVYGGHNDSIRFTDCELRNCGWVAVDLLYSTNILIEYGSVHHCPNYTLRLHGGDFHQGVQSNNRLEGTTVEWVAYGDGNTMIAAAVEHRAIQYLPYHQPNVYTSEQSPITVQSCTFRRIGDSIGGPQFYYDCLIEDCYCVVTDNGMVGAAGTFYGPCRVERCTFQRIHHNPSLPNCTFDLYMDMVTDWIVQDCVFNDCDVVGQIAGKDVIFRRNRITNCAQNPYGSSPAALVMTYRAWSMGSTWLTWDPPNPPTYEDPAPNWQDQDPQKALALINWSVDPWSGYPYATHDYYEYHVVGGAKESIRMMSERVVIKDNLLTDAGGLLVCWRAVADWIEEGNVHHLCDTWRQVDGHWVGLDIEQLNYPAGASVATLVDDGGTAPISSMDSNW